MSETKPLNPDSQLLEAFRPFEHFCKTLLDAYVLVAPDGRILRTNPWFAALVGKKTRAILKASSFDQLLPLNFMGRNLPIRELLKTQSIKRLDEVGARTDRDDGPGVEELNLILGVYPFSTSEQQPLGIFLILRDVTAETNLQAKYKEKAKDKLTGLFNRGYFNQYFPAAISMAEKAEHPNESSLCVIMADIDHFKRVNDEYGGHQAGDYVLEQVAALFKEKFRKTDVLCRYGGEEFIVVLPETELEGAMLAAEKLRAAVEAQVFSYKGNYIPVTISMGIARLRVGQEDGATTIERADQALYHAKRSGRNQVCQHNGNEIS